MPNPQLFINDLKLNIDGEVLTDKISLGIYSTDASIYQIMPLVVVLPKDEKDVVAALKIASDHEINILPRGGGTSLAGQTVGNSMVLDFSKFMNRVIEINHVQKWAVVQPGLVRDDLNEQLKKYKLQFAPDPATSSRANIGGMIGNNSSGTKSILYGKTVDHILELKILLADGTPLRLKKLSNQEYKEKAYLESREGEIYRGFEELITPNKSEIRKRFPKVMRRVQGYNLDEFIEKDEWNLSQLICGSEGTLATIVEAKLNLELLPECKSVCVVHFSEVLEAIEAVSHILKFQPAAVEILDSTVLNLSRTNLTTSRHCQFLEGNPAAILIVEFYGETQEEVSSRPKLMIDHLRDQQFGYAYPLFPEGKDYDDVWTIRKKGLGLMLGMKGDKKPLPFIEDAGIPKEHLPEYIDRVLKICKHNNTEAAMYAHASVGVIHVRPILDLRQEIDILRFKRISEETFKLVQEYGGSWSGEHGDGLVRSYYLREYFGEQVYGLLKSVKQLFDPTNRMNPGKIIDAPEIDQNLRYGTSYRDKELSTVFKYRDEESFGNAVHMCTGVGECRKILGGTMCPSFKATRDEEHSTRGRSNALRLAMSGQLGEKGLMDNGLKEALDLCLSCKACKSECPSNVDMAKLKSEVLQMRYDQNGISIRDRMIKDASPMARVLSGRKSALINFVLNSKLASYLFEKVAGFDRRRKLPNYANQSFENWFNRNYKPSNSGNLKVILFADTYLNYHEPQIGIAATQLLDAFGYEVILANLGCCQRPKISHGFIKEAKKNGEVIANKLEKLIDSNIPVVVCEPSCASALNDDLPDLLEDEKLSQKLKENVMSLDIFISGLLNNNDSPPKLSAKTKKILLHGHCHQKALYGTGALKSIFESISGVEIEEIPSGCCGMAGSFGYEKEHYDLSEKIGEEILFPAVRNAARDSVVIASGFSCRHQIEHFTNKKAIHWTQVIQVDKD